MKSILRLIRRYVGILLLSCVLLLALNFIVLAVLVAGLTPNSHPWTTAEEVANALQWTGEAYILPRNR